MTTILFYAFLMANGALLQGHQEFDDRAACEATRDAMVNRWAPSAKNPEASAFCTAKASQDDVQTSQPAVPAPASGSIRATAPAARK